MADTAHWCEIPLWNPGEPDDAACPTCGAWFHFGDAFPLVNAWRPMTRLGVWWKRRRGRLGKRTWVPGLGRCWVEQVPKGWDR